MLKHRCCNCSNAPFKLKTNDAQCVAKVNCQEYKHCVILVYECLNTCIYAYTYICVYVCVHVSVQVFPHEQLNKFTTFTTNLPSNSRCLDLCLLFGGALVFTYLCMYVCMCATLSFLTYMDSLLTKRFHCVLL